MNEFLDNSTHFLLSTIPGRLIFGILSSFLYLTVLILIMRPKVKISPFICFSKDKVSGEYYYIFKIVNSTWFFHAYDIEFVLEKHKAEPSNYGKKLNYRIDGIDLNTTKRNSLKGSIPFMENGESAFLVRTKNDLDPFLKDEDVHLVLTVKARHSFSNLSRVSRKEFMNTDIVHKDNEFKYGRFVKPLNSRKK